MEKLSLKPSSALKDERANDLVMKQNGKLVLVEASGKQCKSIKTMPSTRARTGKMNFWQAIAWSNHFLLTRMALIGLLVALWSAPAVCQDFEDLTSSTNKQHTFQPQQQNSRFTNQQQPQSSASGSRHQMLHRPVLSSRFAPPTQNGATSSGPLAAQASTNAAVFSSAPSNAAPAVAPSPSSPSSSGPASVSNIEQLMKNALARTAKLNSEAGAEPRSDSAPEVAPASASKPVAAKLQSVGESSPQTAQTTSADKQADASETQATEADQENKQTTLAGGDQASTSAHETVYSDQRFANLFARRNNLKKSKIQPHEQIKAKPTLPSFIKSLPDPKQFAAAQAAQEQSVRSVTAPAGGASSFASQRAQLGNNQLGRLNNGQKKPIVTSTSAANASNKRTNSLNGKQQVGGNNSPTGASKQLAAASSLKPSAIATSKAVNVATSNNPFSRSQAAGNNDQANVIAMARKRLLANNALESAKIKQQKASSAANVPSATAEAS